MLGVAAVAEVLRSGGWGRARPGAEADRLELLGGEVRGPPGARRPASSVLAAAVARDPDVAHHFPDGLFWMTLGQKAELVAAQIDLLRRLGKEETQIRSAIQGAKALRATLADRRCF
jgi:hypothetical protein